MLTRPHVYASLIGLLLAAITAHADDLSDLEKLQRQIDAAKAAKQSKPAAAPAPKRKTTHAPVHAEAAPPAPQGSGAGLLWTQSDNGADIDWHEATRYCSAKGDWRLPTRGELWSLLRGSETTPCGITTCRVSPKFRLTNYWFWSNEMAGSSEAWIVNLNVGYQNSDRLDSRDSRRALCVRRP